MNIGDRYRLDSPTLVIGRHERVSFVLPVSSVVRVIGMTDAAGLIPCEWSDKEVLIFAVDLRSRGVRLSNGH
jgi:hypothetical protein